MEEIGTIYIVVSIVVLIIFFFMADNISKIKKILEANYKKDSGNMPYSNVTGINNLHNAAIKSKESGNYKDAIGFINEEIKLVPDQYIDYYDLASNYSLLKDKKNAFYYLSKAVQLGFNDHNAIMTHPDFEFLRNQPEFESFVSNDYKY